MRKFSSVLGAVAILGCASLAHANYVIGYSVNGGAAALCDNNVSDDAAGCFAVATSIGGGLTVTSLTGASNSPGLPSGADQEGSTTTITATSAATLTIWFAAQNFTNPLAPPALAIDYASNVSITTFLKGSSGSVALESCVDQSNGTAPPVGTFCSAPAATLTNLVLPISGALGGSASNTVGESFTPLHSPFSLSQRVDLILGAGTKVNLVTSQALSPVPEPASIVLFGGAMLFVIAGSRAARRKRNQSFQA